jgi:hypothetical protein
LEATVALTNILREPVREVTESMVGIAIVVAVLGADYLFSAWLNEGIPARDYSCFLALGMLVGLIFAGMIVIGLAATHALGTAVCNALDRRGIQLRPIRRPLR